MQVEVDQSGKIGDTKVLAYSDGKSKERSILVPAKVKRTCIRELRQMGKGDALYYQLFATGLFLLLKADIEDIDQVIIDIEYRGKNNVIREHVLNLFRRVGKKVKADQIKFDLIHRGRKKPPAHDRAYYTYAGEVSPDRVVTVEEMLRELK